MSPDELQHCLEQDYRAWMLKFRQECGRPMTGLEHAMAKVAHATGFSAGFDAGIEVAEAQHEALTAAIAAARPTEAGHER